MTDDDQKRLDSLEDKLQAFTPTHEDKKKSKVIPNHNDSKAGARAGIELVASLAASIVIGLGLDHWLGTKPLFLLVFFFIGLATGFYNVYRLTNGMGSTVGYAHLHKKQTHKKKKD